MIGYYVHHQGQGHLHRALALTAALDEPVTGLSSLPRPDAWPGPWLRLPHDVDGPTAEDVTAGGQLHWVPRHGDGLVARMRLLSEWLATHRPRLVVVDVSAEVTVLARLHGVPVAGVVLPGPRTDPAHLTAFRMSEVLLSAWPAWAGAMSPGLPDDLVARLHPLGAVSRYAPIEAPRPDGSRHAVVLQGRGGHGLTTATAAQLEARTPGWRWTVLGTDTWVADPSDVLRDADVVVTQAGQGSVADVAAHRRPAVVVPAARPFDEQTTTAAVLRRAGLPVVVLDRFPEDDLAGVLDEALALDGAGWDRWYDGRAAQRFARLVGSVRASRVA